MDEKQLYSEVKKNPLHLLYFTGNDIYAEEQAVKAISDAVGAQPEIFDIRKMEPERLGEYFYSFSLLGGNRLLILDGFSVSTVPAAAMEYLEDSLADIPEELYLILRNLDQEETRFSVPKGVQKLLALVPGSDSVLFLKKSGYSLTDMISRMAGEYGCRIERGAVDRLIELRGDDSMVLRNEIQKLAAGSGYSLITVSLVNELCVSTVETGVYDMLKLLERGNEKGALEALNTMLLQKAEPIMIAGTLNTAFINIARAKSMKSGGKSLQDMFAMFDYAKNDRKVEIAWKQAERYTADSVQKAVDVLYRLDKDLKSTRNDRNTVLEVAVT